MDQSTKSAVKSSTSSRPTEKRCKLSVSPSYKTVKQSQEISEKGRVFRGENVISSGEIYQMELADVDFLRSYVERYPELAGVMWFDPPSVRCGKGWKRVSAFRLQRSGIELELVGGGRTRLFPRKRFSAARARFRVLFRKVLREHFPSWKVVRLLSGTDRTRHQSAALLRMLLWDGRSLLAVLVLYPEEPQDVSDRIFSSALLWWDRLQAGQKISKMVIFLPGSWGEFLLKNFPKVNVPLLCYKYEVGRTDPAGDVQGSRVRQIYPRRVEFSELRSPYVLFPYERHVPSLLREMGSVYPLLDLAYRRKGWELSYLGLRVAWYQEDRQQYFFDLENPRILHACEDPIFKGYLDEVIRFRSFPPLDPEHFNYRFGHEQWLESLVLKNHRILNSDFADAIYCQVPSRIDGQRKILDLLTITNHGRLAVLELKVFKDLDLIFQGLDYWERVNYHLQQKDFQRSGYFDGMSVVGERPLLYLVCPLFEFHRVMPVLRRYLKEEITIRCVGINSDWRKGIEILRWFDY